VLLVAGDTTALCCDWGRETGGCPAMTCPRAAGAGPGIDWGRARWA